MKYLEIIPQLNSGGAERFVVDLCNELAENADVTLVVLHSLDKNGFYKEDISNRVKVLSLDKKMGADISLHIRILRLLRSLHPDIVHTHLGGIDYTLLSAFFYRSPKYVHTIHSDAKMESTGGIKRLIRFVAFKTGLFIPVTISPSTEKSFRSFYGINGHMIMNGRRIPDQITIDDALYKEFECYRKNGRVLTMLARFQPEKRHVFLSRIAKRLYEEGWRFSLLMIGNQADKEILQEVINNATPNVFLLGQKHNPLSYLVLSDAFCLCSQYEGMPISLIEALSCGVLPICTPVGGIVDVVFDGENGILSQDLSEDAYYEALVRFLSMSDDELKRLRKRVLDSSKQFSMEECTRKYIELFMSTKSN